MIYIYTACAYNFLPKACVLAESLRKNMPEAHLCLGLADEVPKEANAADYGFDSIVSPADMADYVPDITAWVFKHDVMELSTAIKGFILEKLLHKDDCQAVFYLDPDCVVFESLDTLTQCFDNNSILITPHYITPVVDPFPIWTDFALLKHGTYNLGFLGVKNDKNGQLFARWWKLRLRDYCCRDYMEGMFTDQKWIDLVPACFDGVDIIREPQYNFADWNFWERKVGGDSPHSLTANGKKIVFFHVAGVYGGTFTRYANDYSNKPELLMAFLDWYENQCENFQSDLTNRLWPYGFYSNGEEIAPKHRLLYRKNRDLQLRFPNPFDAGTRPSFIQYTRNQTSVFANELKKTCERLENDLRTLYNSKSWKITAPLRKVKKWF